MLSSLSQEVTGEAAHLWEDLLVLECPSNTGADVGLHMFPSSPLQTDVNIGSTVKLLNTAAAGISRRAKCACPSIPDTEIESRFIPGVRSMLRYFEGATKSEPASCPGSFNEGFFDDTILGQLYGRMKMTQLDFPSTCTYATWDTHGTCSMQLVEPVTETSLHVTISKCPGSVVPSVRAGCSGPICRTLFSVCLSSDDCTGGQHCKPSITSSQILSFMESIGVVAKSGSPLSKCDGADGITKKLFTELADLFGWAGNSTIPTKMDAVSVCMPTPIQLFDIGLAWLTATKKVNVDLAQTTEACQAVAGCDVRNVGNGLCNPECNVDACKNDGGDCKWKPRLRCPSNSVWQECSGAGMCVPDGQGPFGPYDDDYEPVVPGDDDNGAESSTTQPTSPVQGIPGVDDDDDNNSNGHDNDDDNDDNPPPDTWRCICHCGNPNSGDDCSGCPSQEPLCPLPTPSPTPKPPLVADGASSNAIPSLRPFPSLLPPRPNFACSNHMATYPNLHTYLKPYTPTPTPSPAPSYFTPSLSPVVTDSKAGVTVLAYAACDGTIGHMVNSEFGTAMYSRHHQDLMTVLSTMLEAAQFCRAKSHGVSTLSAAQFATRYQPWQLPYFLFSHSKSGWDTAMSPGFDFGNRLSDLLPSWPNSTTFDKQERYLLPDTCWYNSSVARIPEACRVALTSVESLTGAPGTGYLQVRRCPGVSSSAHPEVVMAYKGDLQAMLARPKPCSSNSDCGSGLLCQDVLELLHDGKDIQGGKYRDPLGRALFGPTDFDNVCSSSVQWGMDVRAMMFDVGAMKHDGQTSTKFCLLNTTYVEHYHEWKKQHVNRACMSHDDNGDGTTQPDCAHNPVTVAGLERSTLDLTLEAQAPTPTPASIPSNAHPGEKLLAASMVVPADVSLEDFKAMLETPTRTAIIDALSELVPGLSLSHVFLTDTHEQTRTPSRRLETGLKAGTDVSVVFAVEVPNESADAVSDSMQPGGSFSSHIGQDLAAQGVIPDGSQGGVHVNPTGVPSPSAAPSASTGPGGHSPSNAGPIAGGVVGGLAVVTVGAAAVALWYRRKNHGLDDKGEAAVPLTVAAGESPYGSTNQA